MPDEPPSDARPARLEARHSGAVGPREASGRGPACAGPACSVSHGAAGCGRLLILLLRVAPGSGLVARPATPLSELRRRVGPLLLPQLTHALSVPLFGAVDRSIEGSKTGQTRYQPSCDLRSPSSAAAAAGDGACETQVYLRRTTVGLAAGLGAAGVELGLRSRRRAGLCRGCGGRRGRRGCPGGGVGPA